METWRAVPGYEGLYDVSDHGRVRSWHQRWPSTPVPRLLKMPPDKQGRLHVTLHKDGVQTVVHVHRLVMNAFVGPLPAGMETRHLDGDYTNNHWPSNLVYGTRAENQQDSINHGTQQNVRKTHCPSEHPLSGTNLYVDPQGRRHCRACRKEQWQSWYDRHH
jgi:hypothetical protein